MDGAFLQLPTQSLSFAVRVQGGRSSEMYFIIEGEVVVCVVGRTRFLGSLGHAAFCQYRCAHTRAFLAAAR